MDHSVFRACIEHWWLPFFGFIVAAFQFTIHAQGNSVNWPQSEPLQYVSGILLMLLPLFGVFKDRIIDELKRYVSNLGLLALCGLAIFFVDLIAPSELQRAEANLNFFVLLLSIIVYMSINTFLFALVAYAFVDSFRVAITAFWKLRS